MLFSIRLFAAALLSGAALASCDGAALTDELPPSPPTVGTLPISFDATTTDAQPDATSRAGELTTSNLREMGVFASYTGTDNWNLTHTPNFMYNQLVTRSNANSPWTYTPLKYWPNTPGEKIAFFAYSPYIADLANVSQNTFSGYPEIYVIIPNNENDQSDVLVAVPIFATRSTGPLQFTFRHIPAKLEFQVKTTSDIVVTGLKLKSMAGGFIVEMDRTSVFIRNGIEYNANVSLPLAIAGNETKTVATFYTVGVSTSGGIPKIELTYTQKGSSTILGQEIDFPRGDFFWDDTRREGKHTIFTLTLDEVRLSVSASIINTNGGGWLEENAELNGTPIN